MRRPRPIEVSQKPVAVDAQQAYDTSAPLAEGDERRLLAVAPTVLYTDAVDASGAASFPASDPPSWWAGR